MASLQAVRVKGNTYYRLVTCRRIGGKPTPVVLAYLGLLGMLGIFCDLRGRSQIARTLN